MATRRLEVVCLKTKMCRFFMTNKCFNGGDCTYAHCPQEISTAPNLHKTKMCPVLIRTGGCSRPSCSFAHEKSEIRKVNMGKDARPGLALPRMLVGEARTARTCKLDFRLNTKTNNMALAGNKNTLRPSLDALVMSESQISSVGKTAIKSDISDEADLVFLKTDACSGEPDTSIRLSCNFVSRQSTGVPPDELNVICATSDKDDDSEGQMSPVARKHTAPGTFSSCPHAWPEKSKIVSNTTSSTLPAGVNRVLVKNTFIFVETEDDEEENQKKAHATRRWLSAPARVAATAFSPRRLPEVALVEPLSNGEVVQPLSMPSWGPLWCHVIRPLCPLALR
mmetsp:Transcript_146249/g.467262  ORF Transcript_146249/g.467262 Transcript_146249/m.467262 type:complete len:337 (-) Transcript_146249:330-1340(-)